MNLTPGKLKVKESIDKLSSKREKYLKRSCYYYKNLINFFKFIIPENSSVIELGCGTGEILNAVRPSRGVGIDFSEGMLKIAEKKYPGIDFIQMDIENITIGEKFDFIIISDTLGYLEDIQKAFRCIHNIADSRSRLIITYHSFLWQPFLSLAEKLGLKMRWQKLNWLNRSDIVQLLEIEDYDIIKSGKRYLLPIHIPIISWLFNKFIAYFPFFNNLCLTGYIIARKREPSPDYSGLLSTSIIIPARNERGNIEDAIKRMPSIGRHTEIIFVEGNSDDGTYDEITRVYEQYKGKVDIKYCKQDGKGKGDAVRKGFEMASGEILIILDADLTVSPEELPKFYNAIASNKGEYINGSRLVYPMEREAMRTLNIIGNKFFSIMFTWILGQRIKDTLCGTKALSKENYIKLKNNRSYFGEFDPFGDFDLIFGSAKLNLKFQEIPIRYKARKYGETNISRFQHGWLLLKMVLYSLSKIKFID